MQEELFPPALPAFLGILHRRILYHVSCSKKGFEVVLEVILNHASIRMFR